MLHTKTSIQELLLSNDQSVIQALRAIHNRQTDAEKAIGVTSDHNRVGFSAFDAPFLTDMVRSLREWGRLTPKQMAVTRKKMMRYHRQLVELANEHAPLAGPVAPAGFGVATMQSVSPDPVVATPVVKARARYQAMCGCEENDGEVALSDCPTCLAALVSGDEPCDVYAGSF